jgi:hypothetical protein
MSYSVITDETDFHWLWDVHNVPGGYHFAILHGNEDSPQSIELWRSAEPKFGESPDLVMAPDANGKMQILSKKTD